MSELIYGDECYRLVGACFEVHREKGCAFLKPIYQECLAIELGMQKIPFEQQVSLPLEYKGVALKQRYVPDFVCWGKIVVEIKAVSRLADEHRAQVLSYLAASKMKLGLLVNFGAYPQMEWQRLVNTRVPANSAKEYSE